MIVLPNLPPAPWRTDQFLPPKQTGIHGTAVDLIDQLATRYGSVPALARAMGVHPSRLYNVRAGTDKAGEKFLARLEAVRRRA